MIFWKISKCISRFNTKNEKLIRSFIYSQQMTPQHPPVTVIKSNDEKKVKYLGIDPSTGKGRYEREVSPYRPPATVGKNNKLKEIKQFGIDPSTGKGRHRRRVLPGPFSRKSQGVNEVKYLRIDSSTK